MKSLDDVSSLIMLNTKRTNLVLLAEKSLERWYGSKFRVGRRVVEPRFLPGLSFKDRRQTSAVLLVKSLHEYHCLALEAQLQARALAPDERLRLLAEY